MATKLPPTPTPSTPSKLELARQKLAGSSLSVTAPGSDKARPILTSPTVVTLPLSEIQPYERNPRTDPNDCFDDIKESIRVAGLDSIMQVTRQPGAAHYTVAKGGNTRLRALKELWDETKDPRFESVLAQIVDWKSHAVAIADHLKENTLRGAMSFFDKAKACAEIRAEIAKAEGKPPGVRELVKVLHDQHGLALDHATLGRYLHVAEHFSALKPWINNPIAKTLIPPFNALVRLGIKFERHEDEIHQELQAALTRYAADLSVREHAFDEETCIVAMENAIAVFLGLTLHQLKFALAALAVSPAATKAELITAPEPLERLDQLNGAGGHGSGAPGPGEGDDGGGGDSGDDLAGSGSAATGGLDATRSMVPNRGKTNAQIALELGAQSRAAAQAAAAAQAGQNAGGAPSAPTPPAPAPAPVAPTKKALSVEAALDAVIDAAARFADLCGVSELCNTSLALPCGFFMEIGDDATTLPTSDCQDARVRVGGWWLAATLTRQWDEDQARLLPATAMWRKFWVQEERDRQGAADPGSIFEVIQDHLGGLMGDDGRVAVSLEYMHAVLADADRAAAYSELVFLVNQLHAIRNRGG